MPEGRDNNRSEAVKILLYRLYFSSLRFHFQL